MSMDIGVGIGIGVGVGVVTSAPMLPSSADTQQSYQFDFLTS